MDLKHPLTPNDMEERPDVDPATLEIFKTVLESRNGRVWLTHHVIDIVSKSHILILGHENGMVGYITPDKFPNQYRLTIKPEDSWLKKWIKRQLM